MASHAATAVDGGAGIAATKQGHVHVIGSSWLVGRLDAGQGSGSGRT
jgi:hypothetical protein